PLMRAGGVIGEFPTPAALLAACHALRARGFANLETYTPYALDGLDEALGRRRSRFGFGVFVAGMIGVAVGFTIQWWCNAVDYPLNVGGRPLFSWPAWVPITFETAVLFASAAAFFGVLGLARLPRLWQPIFEVDG